jgi:integrase
MLCAAPALHRRCTGNGEVMKTPAKFAFTKTELAAIKPPATGRIYLYDNRIPGLTFCITAHDVRTFYLARRVAGRYRRIRLGTPDELTVDQARRRAAELNNAVATGKDPIAEKRAAREAMTLDELWKLFDEMYAQPRLRPRSYEAVAGTYHRYLENSWGGKKVREIRRHEVVKLHVALKTPHGIYSANCALGLLVQLLNFALDQGIIEANPANRLKRFATQSRERYITAEEMPAFLTALEQAPQLTQDLVGLALTTGARRSNLMAMRWDEISLNFATWTIPAEKMKKGRSHVVPLVPEAMAILTRRREEQGTEEEWVFPAVLAEGGHLKEIKCSFKTLCRNGGITGLRLHDLRRTLASWMVSTNANESAIAAALAHKRDKSNVTAIYARASLDTVRTAIAKAVKAMWEAGEVKPETAKRAAS